MKRLILALIVALAWVTASAQGRIQFANDSLHLVYYSNPGGVDGIVDGSPVWANNMPFGASLVADFYLGTSSSSLSLATTTTFSSTAPGKWNPYNYQWNGVPGGTTVYVLAQVRNADRSAEQTWTPEFSPSQQGFSLYGASQEFSFVLGTSVLTYPPMYYHNAVAGGGFSTWTDGTYDMGIVTPLLANNRGALVVPIWPEPTILALASFGAGVMLLFRHTNRRIPVR